MKVIYVDISSEEKINLAVQEAVSFLKEGKTIVYPTDTIYGLGCDAMNEKAIEKVYKIKKRDESKPFSVIAKNIEAIKKIAFVDRRTEGIASKLLPGPANLTAGNNSIGVRIPNNVISQKIADAFTGPIVTTSVNLSGEESLNDPFKIVEYFREKELVPDLVLDCGKIKNAQTSIIIDLTRKSPQILRSGTRSLSEIMAVLEKLKDL